MNGSGNVRQMSKMTKTNGRNSILNDLRIEFDFIFSKWPKTKAKVTAFILSIRLMPPRLLCFHPFIRLTVREDRIIYIDKIPPQKIHTESHVFCL